MEETAICPNCGNLLVHQEGCLSCPSCGWSECDFGNEGLLSKTDNLLITFSYYARLEKEV